MTQLALYEMPKKECRRVAISVPIPKWLPPSLALWLRRRMAERPEGKLTVATRFSKGERAAMKRRRPVPISAWAEKHRVLEMSAIRGRWRNVFTPYLTGIMDVSGLPGVETVIICKSPQTGGSECGHNIVGYCIDRLPGPVMYVFPDELTARENAKDRIIPMIEASPRLRQYMTGYGDDASSLRINLLHMPIYLGWSGSVSRLGNKPIRILILDELDKYKNPKNEASSESLAEKRTTTWRTRRKVVKISTPTTEDGPIWKALIEEAGARFDFWVRCPHCGFFQHMDFERIAWPGKDEEKSPDAETVLAKRLAYYACEYCGTVWDDGDRDRAVRGGEWRERTSGLELMAHVAAHRPVKVGFHIPAWLSYFVSLSEVAHAWLKYKESGKLTTSRISGTSTPPSRGWSRTRPAWKTPSSPCATTAHAGRFPARWTEKSGYPSFWPRWTRSSTISGTSSGPTAMAKPRRAGSWRPARRTTSRRWKKSCSGASTPTRTAGNTRSRQP